MKKVYIIHGWGGYSEEGWFPWLKKELEAKGFEATVFEMPESQIPKIETWVKYLEDNIQDPDEETVLVGHSIGCQTILRYLEKLPLGVKVGKLILVAPWFVISNLKEEELPVAKPWEEIPIDEKNVLSHVISRIVAIFSDNDPFVSSSNQEIFSKEYEAEIIVQHKKGHFFGNDGVNELPVVLEKI